MKQVVSGQDKLFKKLATIEKKVGNKILRTELRAGAKEMATEAKALAPSESGQLKRAIKVRAGKRKKGSISFQAQIAKGQNAWYGSFVDLGTKSQPAQHFLEGGFDLKVDELRKSIPQRILQGIRQAAKGGA